MANRTLGIIGRIMNWHATRSDIFRSPIVRGMARASEKARFGPMLRFILLTATRRNEAAYATQEEIIGGEWTIPASRYKTKIDHLIPLSKAALTELTPAAGRIFPGPLVTDPFIFSSTGKHAIGGLSRHKQAIDEASGVKGWTIHDFRRTARSLMSRAGVNADIAERCLGHVIPGVRGVYDRHEYLEEKRRAFEALATQIDRIINPATANVVPLRGER